LPQTPNRHCAICRVQCAFEALVAPFQGDKEGKAVVGHIGRYLLNWGMKKAKLELDSTLRNRYQNMVASFRIEGIELDATTRSALDEVLTGKITAAALEKQILADYLSVF
jgi:hypothetical protein